METTEALDEFVSTFKEWHYLVGGFAAGWSAGLLTGLLVGLLYAYLLV